MMLETPEAPPAPWPDLSQVPDTIPELGPSPQRGRPHPDPDAYWHMCEPPAEITLPNSTPKTAEGQTGALEGLPTGGASVGGSTSASSDWFSGLFD